MDKEFIEIEAALKKADSEANKITSSPGAGSGSSRPL